MEFRTHQSRVQCRPTCAVRTPTNAIVNLNTVGTSIKLLYLSAVTLDVPWLTCSGISRLGCFRFRSEKFSIIVWVNREEIDNEYFEIVSSSAYNAINSLNTMYTNIRRLLTMAGESVLIFLPRSFHSWIPRIRKKQNGVIVWVIRAKVDYIIFGYCIAKWIGDFQLFALLQQKGNNFQRWCYLLELFANKNLTKTF